MKFVKNADIDFLKWDAGIASCYNENPYAYSRWLNLVSPGWGALLNESYSILMPLPLKKKAGITYISQPRFTQQLGIFTQQPPDESLIKEMLALAGKKYLKIHLQLNTENADFSGDLKSRITCQLPLLDTYDSLFKRFSTHHKRNISKALQLQQSENLEVVLSEDHSLFYETYLQTAALKDPSLTATDHRLIKSIISDGYGQILFCLSPEGNVYSGLFYLKSRTKIINLFNFNTLEGNSKKTMYLLLNHWIAQHSEQAVTLDFEGSEIKSIARFYNGFGAEEKKYPLFTKKGFW